MTDTQRREVMSERAKRERDAVYESKDYLSGDQLARKLASFNQTRAAYTPESALEEFRLKMAQ